MPVRLGAMAGLALFMGLADPATVEAAPIVGAHFSTGDRLLSVGFDGADFVGFATVLEDLSPDWTAMSYDADSEVMFFVTGDQLKSVGFDGTDFVGFATVLEDLSPDWTAMSYDANSDVMYFVTGDRLLSVGFDGADFVGFATVLETLSPDWTGMSLVFGDPVSVPEPAALALFGIGLAGLGCSRRNRANRLKLRPRSAGHG